jgi:hypothetical protein
MADKYYPPTFEEKKFNCPRCGVYADQQWYGAQLIQFLASGRMRNGSDMGDFDVSECRHCEQYSFWFKKALIYPAIVTAVEPHDDMPDDVKADFEEARQVERLSPRSAAALLRLAMQKLMPHLGEKGKKLDDDIAALVKKGAIAEHQQHLCDFVRVVGNNAVHPGEIDLNDTPETATVLFGLINDIVDEKIGRIKKNKRLYDSLPQSAKDAIDKRDKKSKP